jgi:hypothetical protein
MADDLSPIVSEFATQAEADAYDAWLKAKVERSIADPRPTIPNDQVMRRIRGKLLKHAPGLDV